MRSLDLDRKPDGKVTIDLCGDCQAIWFDTFESTQLTPGATLELFRVIHATAPETRRAMPAELPCPRCETLLAYTHDLQHATRFAYYRCRYSHGRFTPFFQFLREKNFVRPLDAVELARLKQSVRTIRCESCGAPVDLERSTVCAYCQAPIMVLDPDAVQKTLRELTAAEQRRIAPDPDKLGDSIVAIARLESEMERARRADPAERGIDLVGIGLTALGAFLKWR